MDVAYDFELGGAAPRNGVHRLVLFPTEPAQSEGFPAHLPADNVQLRIRRQRYHNLAFHIAELDRVFAESPDDQTRLPIAVAERWIERLGVQGQAFTLRCERVDAPRWQEDLETFDAAGKAVESKEATSFDIHLVWSPLIEMYEGFRAQSDTLTAKATDRPAE